jgi:hypothetical protein
MDGLADDAHRDFCAQGDRSVSAHPSPQPPQGLTLPGLPKPTGETTGTSADATREAIPAAAARIHMQRWVMVVMEGAEVVAVTGTYLHTRLQP